MLHQTRIKVSRCQTQNADVAQTLSAVHPLSYARSDPQTWRCCITTSTVSDLKSVCAVEERRFKHVRVSNSSSDHRHERSELTVAADTKHDRFGGAEAISDVILTDLEFPEDRQHLRMCDADATCVNG